METPICLEIKNLSVAIKTRHGLIKPVRDLSLKVPAGKILGVVGESGSGKSLMARSILRLGSKDVNYSGEIIFEGTNLLGSSEQELRGLRGRRISMIFQDPSAALNPVLPIGWQLQEMFTAHNECTSKQAFSQSIDLLAKVGLDKPEKIYRQFPYQLSGGMKQRVMIAMAIALKPALLIADEPTTALDMTVQAQVLEVLRNLQKEYGITIMLISHDMGVIAEMADNVVVMKNGELVERGDCFAIFDRPCHEYTKSLLDACRLTGLKQNWGQNVTA